MECLALELVGPWVVLGFIVGMEAFDDLLSINVPWSQGLDLSLLLPLISIIFTVVSKLLLLYSTIDKNIYVKDEKFLYCEGHSERFTALHGEKKRVEGVRGDPNEMRWNQ